MTALRRKSSHRRHHRSDRSRHRRMRWSKTASGGGWQGSRRRGQRHDDVVPGLRGPAALLHRRGLGGAKEHLHPVADLSALKGDSGTDLVPALAKEMPQISGRWQDHKLTLRPNMKYSDGSPIKASDFHLRHQRLFQANSGWLVSYEGIVGGLTSPTARPTQSQASPPDDNTGDITISSTSPAAIFTKCPGLMFAARFRRPPADKDATNNLPPSSGPFVISKVNAPNSLCDGAQNLQFKTIRTPGQPGAGMRRSTRSPSRRTEQLRAGDGDRAETRSTT